MEPFSQQLISGASALKRPSPLDTSLDLLQEPDLKATFKKKLVVENDL